MPKRYKKDGSFAGKIFKKGEKTNLGKHWKIKDTSKMKGHKSWLKGKHIKINDALDKWRESGGIPWAKGKKFTSEHRRKIIKHLKGNKYATGKRTEEQKQRMRKPHKKMSLKTIAKMKGRIPWNKNKKGLQIGWTKGKKIDRNKYPNFGHLQKHTEITKKKISQANKGKIRSEESRRKNSLAHKGEKSYLWQGGISFEPYSIDWTETLRKSIRERDNYICQLCGRTQIEELEELEMKLTIHHIDYNKKNSNPDNLITLCRSCNSRVNKNRDYWLNYFKKL